MSILIAKLCLWCSTSFQTTFETKSYCDRKCKELAKQSRKWFAKTSGIELLPNQIRRAVKTFYVIQCKNCGESISTTKKNKLYCDYVCADMLSKTRKRQNQVKKFKKASAPNIVARIYYRDKGICGICKEPIDLRLQYPNLLSLSVDHITPVSQGGTNLQSNLQPAHLICNSKRGNKPLDA
jgi:hypothetical protein